MYKIIRILPVGALLFSTLVMAHVKPLVTLSLGSDTANLSQTNPTLYFTNTIFYNTYVGTNASNTQLLGGVFLGAEFNVRRQLLWQLGVSYYQNSAFQAFGDIYQQGNPAADNSRYEYDIRSKRVLLETKLLCTTKTIFHPYVDVGVGEAFNSASNYNESPYPSSGGNAYPLSPPLANNSINNFTYVAGLGVDMDMSKQLRLGIGYRYADLGKASLGTTPIEQGTTTLKNNALTSNEFLVQISAVC